MLHHFFVLSSLGTQTAGSFTLLQKPGSLLHLKASVASPLAVRPSKSQEGERQTRTSYRKLANTRESRGEPPSANQLIDCPDRVQRGEREREESRAERSDY